MGRTQRVSDVTRIAVLAVLAACGFDPSGLGGGRDSGLALSTTGPAISTAGANSTGDAANTTSVTGVATAATVAESSTASDPMNAETQSTGGSSGSGLSDGTSSGDDEREQTSRTATGGASSSGIPATASTGSSGAECTDPGPIEGLLFVSEAALEGYTLRASEALEAYRGEPVLYARSDSSDGEPRTLTFTFDLPCAAPLYWWGLVYTGVAVDPQFDVAWSRDPAGESLRWDYGCGGRDGGWAWVAIGISETECMDRHDAVEADTSAWIRLSSPTSSVSLLAALAHSTDMGFDPHSLYTP